MPAAPSASRPAPTPIIHHVWRGGGGGGAEGGGAVSGDGCACFSVGGNVSCGGCAAASSLIALSSVAIKFSTSARLGVFGTSLKNMRYERSASCLWPSCRSHCA